MTTLETALNDVKTRWLNVKDWGATGDGSTDDTTAVQTAITAMNASGGGVVFIPEATYRLDQLAAKSNVTIIHQGGTVI
jgi:polygalacturonase